MELGTRLLAWRKALGLTQRAVATKLEVSPAAISMWEAGQTSPTQDNLERVVSLVFEITMERFYGELPDTTSAKAV